MFKKYNFKNMITGFDKIYSDLVILAAILFLCKLGGQRIQHTLGKC